MRFKVIFKKSYPLSFALLNAKGEEEVRELFVPNTIDEVITL